MVLWETLLCEVALADCFLTDVGRLSENLAQKGLWNYRNLFSQQPWAYSVCCCAAEAHYSNVSQNQSRDQGALQQDKTGEVNCLGCLWQCPMRLGKKSRNKTHLKYLSYGKAFPTNESAPVNLSKLHQPSPQAILEAVGVLLYQSQQSVSSAPKGTATSLVCSQAGFSFLVSLFHFPLQNHFLRILFGDPPCIWI